MLKALAFRSLCLVPNKIDFVFSWPKYTLKYYQQTSHTNVKNLLVVAFQFQLPFYTGKLCKYHLHKVTNHWQQAKKKIKFSIKVFSSKSDLRICSHLLEKFLMENFFFRAVSLEASHLYQTKAEVALEWILGERHILGSMSWSN